MGALVWLIGFLLALGVLTADDSSDHGVITQLIACLFVWPVILGYAIGTIAYGRNK